ncbi:hypothetical protein DUT91_16485 [Phyllobacterium salinisoli]|uniref:Uncharacterized protein n=1 Tax=Phyllobacterium salinisoli TaxID=1899321 RepID=A0A368K3F2_9HYPH|nr:hypothetical protein [Phyllobacterium salinisoli]RCS22520.1 hypothetical protein DUT91_16485 [Phyllobacterium salinisoli]
MSSDVIEAEIFVGTGTAAVFLSEEPDVDKMGWEELGIQPHRSGPENWGYHEADVFRTWKEKPLGINLVIAQYIDEVRLEIWHLHPDLVVGLGLVQEGDSWFRPQEGWIEGAVWPEMPKAAPPASRYAPSF